MRFVYVVVKTEPLHIVAGILIEHQVLTFLAVRIAVLSLDLFFSAGFRLHSSSHGRSVGVRPWALSLIESFVVDQAPAALPLTESPGAPTIVLPRALLLPRWFAVAQAILVCGMLPTQLFIAAALVLFLDVPVFEGDGGISLQFFATLSLFDTALVALLIRVFLILSGEESRDVFAGRRPIWGEIWRGLALLPVILVGVTAIVLGLRAVAPWLHTVKESPVTQFMQNPYDAAIFLVVVVLAGGVREELQRAFFLHRLTHVVGHFRFGIMLSLAGYSLLFGLMHFDQGVDVAIAVGSLGLLWGVIYVKRRSAVMPMTSHACFNAAQVAQQMIARALGM
jgi:membrane protease YdiL (CAAX protease family)